MPITTKTAAALLAIFLCLFAGAWVILERAVRPGFERLEAADVGRDQARVEMNLRTLGTDLRARVLDYAQWDATYDYFRGRDPTYPTANFLEEWYGNYGVDIVVLVDDSGRVIWTGGPTGPSLEAATILSAQAHSNTPDNSPRQGVAWTELGPVTFASARATGNEGNRTPRGYIIMGKWLSESALSQQVQLDLHIVGADAAGALAPRLAALARGQAQVWTEPDAMHALIPLRAADGSLAGAVSAQRTRDITALGDSVIAIALALFAVMSALALVALWIVLRRMVIARIEYLERHLNAQTGARDIAALEVRGDGDEIWRLSQAYNALVQRLQESGAREQSAILDREAAASANRMKSDFLANISYELRTPLDAIIGYAELIEEELTENGFTQANGDLNHITAATRELLAVINEILDLSKIEIGRLEITPQTFKVSELLDGVADTIGALAKSQGAALELDAPDLGIVYSDQQRLRQCLLNALSSAGRASTGGVLSLVARRVQVHGREMLRFEITRSGAQVSADQLAKAFEPFNAGDSDTARSFTGGGLGLAITGRLMTLLGGRIDASIADGRLTFVLITPALLQEAANESVIADSVAAA